MAQPTRTKKLIIEVDSKNSKALDDIARSMGYLNKSTKDVASNMGFLTNAFKGWIGLLGIRQLAGMSDQIQNLQNRLKITTGSLEEAQAAIAGLTEVANNNFVSIKTAGDIFTRFSLALKSYGATSGEVIDLTDTLVKTFRVSGASAEETSNAVIQLSQAFSIGVLRGQDLRSVLSQNVIIADALKKRYGQNLFKEAEKGTITISEVLKVLSGLQKDITEKANKMAPTFEQTLVKAFNSATVAVGEFSTALKLPETFATTVGFLSDHFKEIAAVLGGALFGLGVSRLFSFATAIKEIGLATALFGKLNPWVVAFTAIAAIGIAVYDNWSKVKSVFFDIIALFANYDSGFLGKIANLVDLAGKISGKDFSALSGNLRKASQEMASLGAQWKTRAEELDKAGKATEKLAGNLGTLTDKVSKHVKPSRTLEQYLIAFNKGLVSGSEGLTEYSTRLNKVNIEKLKNEIKGFPKDLEALREALAKTGVEELTKLFNKGAISFSDYQKRVDLFTISKLNHELNTGKITIIQFNEKLLELNSSSNNLGLGVVVGLERVVKAAGTLAQGVASAIEKTFSHLEESLFDFIKTGTFEFGKFTQAVLDDLLKIIIRASIISPLANGLLAGVGTLAPAAASASSTGGNFGGPTLASANGNVFAGHNIVPFARGGIVNSPTGFTYGGGRSGVMGEAGPEAIVPLSRGNNGKLGVEASITPVTINIMNQSGAGVQQTETTGPSGERQIDILISSKVKDGIVSGKYDTAMKSAYGITRRGS